MTPILSSWSKTSLALALLTVGAGGSPSSAKPLTIMPLGDSITYGYATPNFIPGGYRAPLLQDLTAMGYQVQFVGSDTTNSSPALDLTGNSHQEGHSGFAIDNIANNLDGSDNTIFAQSGLPSASNDGGYWFTGIPGVRGPVSPDIILLHIGTNDYQGYYDPTLPNNQGYTEYQTDPSLFAQHAADRLDSLIGKIVTERPQADVIVSSIIPDVPNNPSPVDYNHLIETDLVPKYQALGDHVSFVDQYAGFIDPATGTPRAGLYGADPTHPNQAGYDQMAQVWAQGIAAVSPAPVPEPAPWTIFAGGAAALAGLGLRARCQKNARPGKVIS